MDQQNIFVGGRLRLQEVFCRRNMLLQEPLVNLAVFLRGKNVLADGKVVAAVVHQPEGEHG